MLPRTRTIWTILLAGPVVAGSASAGGDAWHYAEVTAARGLTAPYDPGAGYGAGASVADFDDDGDLDVFLPTGWNVPHRLYRNDGTGHFTEVAAELGVNDTVAGRTATWLDFSGDGRLDLVVAGDCFSGADPCFPNATIRFFRQKADGTFENVGGEMPAFDQGVAGHGQHRGGMVAGDLTGDGRLDLVVGTWTGPAIFLVGTASGLFVDASAISGLADTDLAHWQPAIHDFNGDGWADIVWAIDFLPNRFWINQQDGTFVDVAPVIGVDNAMNDMGLSLGDVDADGDLDFYITEILEFDFHNVLYRNDTQNGVLAFTEVAVASGVEDTGFGWGSSFLDADNDTHLDLLATNGWFNGIGYDDRTRLFRHLGTDPPTFEDVAPALGVDDADWGACVVAFDMDRDGDLDVLQTTNLGGPLRLYENRRPEPRKGEPANGWLVVRPRMPEGPNHRAIGAVLRAELADGRTLTRRVSAGTGHLGQEPAEAHFGLGTLASVPRLTIRWPDGARTILEDVAANALLDVERSPCAGTADQDGDGAVGFADLLTVLSSWGPCPVACPEDVDRGGSVDVADVAALIAAWGDCAG